ncbi:MAG: hypothetical protein AAFY03_05135, partial [Pseudomonadota bacterium]
DDLVRDPLVVEEVRRHVLASTVPPWVPSKRTARCALGSVIDGVELAPELAATGATLGAGSGGLVKQVPFQVAERAPLGGVEAAPVALLVAMFEARRGVRRLLGRLFDPGCIDLQPAPHVAIGHRLDQRRMAAGLLV